MNINILYVKLHFGWDFSCFLMESMEGSGIIFTGSMALYEHDRQPRLRGSFSGLLKQIFSTSS